MSRDPKINPVAGDCLAKTSANGRVPTRRVIRVDSDGITYVTGKKEKNCWITTWWDWARDANVIEWGEPGALRISSDGYDHHI